MISETNNTASDRDPVREQGFYKQTRARVLPAWDNSECTKGDKTLKVTLIFFPPTSVTDLLFPTSFFYRIAFFFFLTTAPEGTLDSQSLKAIATEKYSLLTLFLFLLLVF